MTAPFPGHSVVLQCGTRCLPREHQVFVPIPPCCGQTLDTLPAGPDSVVAEGKAWEVQYCFSALTQLGSTSSARTGLGEVVSSAQNWHVEAGFP